MNNNYFEIKDNKYIVLEENNNVSLIKADNNIEDILNLENELEHTNNEIKSIIKQIKQLKNDKKSKKFINCSSTITEIGIAIIGLFNAVNLPVLVIFMAMIFVIFKQIDITTYGSFDKINKGIHNLYLQKEILFTDRKDIETKLYRLKYKSNFKKESIPNDIDITINRSKENNKVKKLILKPNLD